MESSVQGGKTLLAISVFSGFIAWDILRACKRRDKWIQGTGLTLTALSVQFLGYFDAQTVNRNSKEQQLRALVNNQLSIDMARLVFCIFLACVLPGVAFHSSGGRWSNIAAIAVSLCLHVATEIYVLQNFNDSAFRNGGRVMFISSSALLLVAAISLVLYIGLAIICCKFTRDRLHLKIPKMLRGNIRVETPEKGSQKLQGSGLVETPEESFRKKVLLDDNNGEVFKYWAIVRGCLQEFWLVSSAFTPAVVLVVTTCVVLVAAKAISRQSLFLRRSSNTSSIVTLFFQFVFIVAGWAILIWRWAVFLLLSVSREAEFFGYREYTKVSVNRFFWLVYLFIQRAWNWSPMDDGSWRKRILIFVWKRILRPSVFFVPLVAILLPIALFFVVLFLLVLLNFFCWRLSKLLASCIRVFPYSKDLIETMKRLVSDAELKVETEAGEVLYVTQSSVKQIVTKMDGAYKEGKACKDITKIIEHSLEFRRDEIQNLLSRNGDIYSYIGVWKMTAVAAISLLVELNCGGDSNETVKDAVKAYKGARDLLTLMDFPDNITVSPMNLFHSGSSRAYQMSLEADIKMQQLEKLIEAGSLYPNTTFQFEAVKRVVSEFKSREQYCPNIKFYQYWSGKRSLDLIEYLEDSDLLKEFSMKCVCQVISKEYLSHDKELVEKTVRCLGDIISYVALNLPAVLHEYCMKWAEELKEENLIKALRIREKCRAIKEMPTSVDTGREINDVEAR